MKKIVGVLIIVGLAVAGYYFTKSDDSKGIKKLQKAQNHSQPQQIKQQKKGKPTLSLKSLTKVPEVTQPQSFKEQKAEFKKCKTVDNPEGFASVEQIKDKLLKDAKLDVQKYEQHKIKLPSGEIQLVSVITKYTDDGKEFTELEHFRLDDDGLPEAIQIDKKLRINPSQSTIQSLTKKGELLEKQNSSAYLKNGQNINVMMENDKVKELRVTNEGKLLNCEFNEELALDCKCIN